MSQEGSSSAPLQFPTQTVRGVKDVLPGETPGWRHLEQTCRELFQRYRFQEIRTPIFEFTGLFARSIGAATDIVEKEMYTFADRNGQSLSLRPEGTASVIRAYIQNGLQQESLTRLYYMGPMFRHERPQAGRLRQFHQIGAEVLGAEGPDIDAELLCLLSDLFEQLKLPVTLEINSIGCPDCRPDYVKFLQAALNDADLCDNCQRRQTTNPLRVLDCKEPGCREGTANAPSILEHLCEVCDSHFAGVQERLKLMGIPYVINSRMVRGLDYYSRTAFEWTTTELGAQNTVAAGGRYDSLNEQLGGKPRPGIGFALGMERLLLLSEPKVEPRADLFVIALGADEEAALLPLIRQMRAAGLTVDRAFGGGSLKSQMKRAGKSGARFTLIVGESELASGEYSLKNMDEGTQESVAADRIIETVKGASL